MIWTMCQESSAATKKRTTYGVTPELHKGLLQAYYASVSYMDAQVGRVLDALKDEGVGGQYHRGLQQ